MLPCHFLAFSFLKHVFIPFRHLFCCKHIERLLAEVWLTNKATKFLPGKEGSSVARGYDMDPAIKGIDQREWIGLWKVAIDRHLFRIVVIEVLLLFNLAAILE
jgi:hypothetical protein